MPPIQVDDFVKDLPKVELHVHIEGTLTPKLRFEIAKRNNRPLPYDTPEALAASYSTWEQDKEYALGATGLAAFLAAYYGGIDVLETEADFYDLGIDYFAKAASMQVRYVEAFFDIQAHTRRGIAVDTVMRGLQRAKTDAAKFGIEASYVLCFLRDESVESAEAAYAACRPYVGDVFHAVGLDSNELDRPPKLFDNVFTLARADGLKVTSHCDVHMPNTHEHIHQVVSELAGGGLGRIDHGLNAAERDDLILAIKQRGIGMTLCPGAYHRRDTNDFVFPAVRKLFDAGVKITINSDDPTYMQNTYVAEALQLVRDNCKFSDAEMVQLERNAVDVCWAPASIKDAIHKELDEYAQANSAVAAS